MTGKRKAILAVAAILCLYLLYAGFGIIRYKASFKSMTPVHTGIIKDDILSIRTGFVNSYLLMSGQEEYIAIDCGLSMEETGEQLKGLGVKPSQIKAVFLTHSDYDHVGGLGLYSDADVYLPESEIVMIDGSKSRGPFMKNSLDGNYIALKDGESVTIGNKTIQVITVGGHTAGSSAYLADNRYLFTGDLIKIDNGRARVFIPGMNMDTGALEKSLNKIARYSRSEMVLTGHFGVSYEPGELMKEIK